MSKKLIILDGNHLAYRAYYKFPNLKTFDGVNTSVVYGIPYIVESLIRKFLPDRAIITLDGGRSSFRQELLPDYKVREQKLGFDKEDFYRQRNDAVDFMDALGLPIVFLKGYEADDLITMVSRRYADDDCQVIIVSGDKDFNQLISDDILVYNVGHAKKPGKLYDKDNLKEEVGYNPDQCVDYLCLTGDKSDNIPGYPGIGEKRGLNFLAKYGHISSYLELGQNFGNLDNDKLREIWKRNRKIIDLKYFYRKFMIHEPIPYKNKVTTFNDKRLRVLCRTFETNSFLKPQFINTYRDLWERSEKFL